MGTPLPPNEPANNCQFCWGVGKPFGDNPTPRVIEARLTRLIPGEFWTDDDDQLLLTTHYLEQRVAPCEWFITDGTFRWSLNYNIQFTSFEVARIADNKIVFVDDQPAPCLVDIPNANIAPAGVVAWNGFANFTWNPEDIDS